MAVTAAEKRKSGFGWDPNQNRGEFKSKVASRITNKTKISEASANVSALLHKCDFWEDKTVLKEP